MIIYNSDFNTHGITIHQLIVYSNIQTVKTIPLLTSSWHFKNSFYKNLIYNRSSDQSLVAPSDFLLSLDKNSTLLAEPQAT